MHLSDFWRNPNFGLVIPLAVIASMVAGIEDLSLFASDYPALVLASPYCLFGIALFLSQLFNQSRIGMITLVMTVSYLVIQLRLQVPLTEGTARLEYNLLVFLLPLNLLYAIVIPPRRILSPSGIFFLSVLGLQLGWGYLLTIHHPPEVWAQVMTTYLQFIPSMGPLPILLTIYSLAASCIAALLVLKRNSSSDRSVFFCLLITFATLFLFDYPYISSISYSFAGLALITSITSSTHQLAFLDGLTGIQGRRALENEIRHLGRRYTLAMMDVDHFKKFNDTYGHDTGDDVLKAVASLLKQNSGVAKVYRYGGEEFTLLFKGKSTDQCLSSLEVVREAISDYTLTIRNPDRPKDAKEGKKQRGKCNQQSTVSVTVSLGVADSDQAKSPHEVLKLADEALYRAKKSGRNCVKT